MITITRNIHVEDPRPTLQHFFLLMEGCEPWSTPDEHRREPGDDDGGDGGDDFEGFGGYDTYPIQIQGIWWGSLSKI